MYNFNIEVAKPQCSMMKTDGQLGGDNFYMSVYTNSLTWCQLACIREEVCIYASAVPVYGWFPCQLYGKESWETTAVDEAVFFEKHCEQGEFSIITIFLGLQGG